MEKFLEEKFMEEREIGGMAITKDNYESLFESWSENLDGSEWIELAQEYADKRYLDGKEEILKGLKPSIDALKALDMQFDGPMKQLETMFSD